MTESLTTTLGIDLDALEPVYIGPTWERDDDGAWVLPRLTLGWQIAGWCTKYLNDTNGEGSWKFTLEQLRFLLWWYATDESGRFVYRKGVLQRMKGWGKDPLLAVICLVEFVGPSRFSHFDALGNPVAVSEGKSLVQVTAVNQNQTDNTMSMLPLLMTDELIATYGIKAGVEVLRANRGRQRIVAVTSNYRTIEGKRTTFTLLNETHHWVSGNGGIKMYETIDGNATKMDTRYLAITNAYLPGEDSVGERMREAYNLLVERDRLAGSGWLYDSIEAHAKTPLTPEALLVVIPKIRGDAIWLRPETILQSALDTTLGAARTRRMWLNQIVADEDALHGPVEWDALEDEGAILEPGQQVVLGFDGGKTDDSTALVAIRVHDQVAFLLGLWERPDGEAGEHWVVPRERVDSAVHEAFRLYDVKAFYADVALWESYISAWSAAYGEQLSVRALAGEWIGWDMRSSQQASTRAHERLLGAIHDGMLRHDGDLAMKRHVLNARRRENNYGVSFGKESKDSPRKVDIYAALMLAHEALHNFRTRGKKEKERTKRGYFL